MHRRCLQQVLNTCLKKRHRCITFLNFFKMYQHGLGIKNNKGAQRFTKHQTDYLRDKFQEGERSGQKQDPIDVSKNMRHAIHNQGNKLFYSEEYLTAQQINSFFSREAKRSKGACHWIWRGRWDQCWKDVEHRKSLYSCTKKCIVLSHPFCFEELKKCKLVVENKLSSLNLRRLKDILHNIQYWYYWSHQYKNWRVKKWMLLWQVVVLCILIDLPLIYKQNSFIRFTHFSWKLATLLKEGVCSSLNSSMVFNDTKWYWVMLSSFKAIFVENDWYALFDISI